MGFDASLGANSSLRVFAAATNKTFDRKNSAHLIYDFAGFSSTLLKEEAKDAATDSESDAESTGNVQHYRRAPGYR